VDEIDISKRLPTSESAGNRLEAPSASCDRYICLCECFALIGDSGPDSASLETTFQFEMVEHPHTLE
jgi:hypothetical protein